MKIRVQMTVLGMVLLTAAAGTAAQPTTFPATQQAISPWGDEAAGVRARLRVPARLEGNMPLAAEIELQGDPQHLPAGITRFNAAYFPAYLRVTLVNLATAWRIEIKSYDPTMGMLPSDTGDASVSLIGGASTPLFAAFPLRGQTIASGEYECIVDFASDRNNFHKDGAAAQPGWWSGRFSTGPARIAIVPETRKTRAILVPTRIRGTPGVGGFRFLIDKDDVESITVPVRNGCFVGMRIDELGDMQGSMSVMGFSESLDGVVEQLRLNGSSQTSTCTIEIYESTKPPAHLLVPTPAEEGYRTLWKRAFNLTASAR